MKYYAAIKRNAISPHVKTWKDLGSITLSEIRQTWKNKHCMISFIHGISKTNRNNMNQKQTHRHRKQTEDCQWGEGARVWAVKKKGVKKYKLSFIIHGKVINMQHRA